MKTRQLYITIYTALFVSLSPLQAQKDYAKQIDASHRSVIRQEGKSMVTMDIVLDNLKINKNHLLIITPVITALEGEEEIELPKMIIKGKIRNKILNRPYNWKGKPNFDTKPQYQVLRKNNSAQTIVYNEEIPYEKWQKQARLWLQIQVIGCAECGEGDAEIPLLTHIYEPYYPIFQPTFIAPEVEPIKQRSETYSADFNYRQGRYELLPKFANNAAQLEKIDKIVREVQGNKDLTFTHIEINGYASPEGIYDSNMTLSRERANTFADYLAKKYGLNKNRFKINWHGEDWDGLRIAIEKEDFVDKEAVLYIIDNISIHEGREKQIMKLSEGKTYYRMLQQLFPMLRRNDCKIGFIARAFNIEEAKELIKTRPDILSLNEMFLVAQSYPKESDTYKEIFETAVRIFPDDPVANINAAAVDLEKNNAESAYKRLEKLKNMPQAWNNLGIALTKLKRYKEAKIYFERAAAQGDRTAEKNAEELQNLLKSL